MDQKMIIVCTSVGEKDLQGLMMLWWYTMGNHSPHLTTTMISMVATVQVFIREGGGSSDAITTVVYLLALILVELHMITCCGMMEQRILISLMWRWRFDESLVQSRSQKKLAKQTCSIVSRLTEIENSSHNTCMHTLAEPVNCRTYNHVACTMKAL